MSSKRRKRRHECERKNKYSTVAAANSAAWKSRCISGDDIWPYKCSHGDHWHIGHKTARKLVISKTKWLITIKRHST